MPSCPFAPAPALSPTKRSYIWSTGSFSVLTSHRGWFWGSGRRRMGIFIAGGVVFHRGSSSVEPEVPLTVATRREEAAVAREREWWLKLRVQRAQMKGPRGLAIVVMWNGFCDGWTGRHEVEDWKFEVARAQGRGESRPGSLHMRVKTRSTLTFLHFGVISLKRLTFDCWIIRVSFEALSALTRILADLKRSSICSTRQLRKRSSTLRPWTRRAV